MGAEKLVKQQPDSDGHLERQPSGGNRSQELGLTPEPGCGPMSHLQGANPHGSLPSEHPTILAESGTKISAEGRTAWEKRLM